jgi:hypothetical protein
MKGRYFRPYFICCVDAKERRMFCVNYFVSLTLLVHLLHMKGMECRVSLC